MIVLDGGVIFFIRRGQQSGAKKSRGGVGVSHARRRVCGKRKAKLHQPPPEITKVGRADGQGDIDGLDRLQLQALYSMLQ